MFNYWENNDDNGGDDEEVEPGFLNCENCRTDVGKENTSCVGGTSGIANDSCLELECKCTLVKSA